MWATLNRLGSLHLHTYFYMHVWDNTQGLQTGRMRGWGTGEAEGRREEMWCNYFNYNYFFIRVFLKKKQKGGYMEDKTQKHGILFTSCNHRLGRFYAVLASIPLYAPCHSLFECPGLFLLHQSVIRVNFSWTWPIRPRGGLLSPSFSSWLVPVTQSSSPSFLSLLPTQRL